MYLKTLEMTGFKSFPDKTVLNFDKGDERNAGVTVIVGPNGSGKSNISDAMRWVLGEISTKSLRSSKMEDVIFGGADARRPMGYAEVSITFDNHDPNFRLDCEFDEVTITRKYYRARESEYYINKRPCRLKDIYTLFLNTGVGRDGYSMIGQGRIAEILSKKSDERRSVFEDASGIAKLRVQKDEAERRLAQKQDNMEKVMLVFNELDSEIGPLEKEASKAKKALELIEVKKNADVRLWLCDTNRIKDDVEKARTDLDRAALDLDNAENSLQSLRTQNERLIELSNSQQTALRDLQEEISRQVDEIHKMENRAGVLESDIRHSEELIQVEERQITSLNANRKAEEEMKAGLAAKKAQLETEKTDKQAEFDKAEQETVGAIQARDALDAEIEERLQNIEEINRELTDLNVRLQVMENAQSSNEGEDVEQSIRSYEDEIARLKGQLDKRAKELEKFDAQIEEAQKALDEVRTSRNQLEEDLVDLREQHQQAIFQREAVQHRIQTIQDMEKNFDGYGGSVKYIMQEYAAGTLEDAAGHRPGKIYGPLSGQIKVQERFVTAIETALGPALQHIVVDNEDTAKTILYALKHADKGRTTVLPISSMSAQTPTREMEEAIGYPGYIDVADKLVAADPKMSGILGSLLGRTLIFDTIEHATALAKAQRFRVKVVTLDGQQINVGGSFTGGSANTKNGLLSRTAELKRLTAELQERSDDVDQKEAALRGMNEDLEGLSEEETNRQDRVNILQKLHDNEQRLSDRTKDEFDIQSKLLDKLRADYQEIQDARLTRGQEIERMKESRAEIYARLNNETKQRADRNAEREEMNQSVEKFSAKQTELRYAIEGKEHEIETQNELIGQSEARMQGYDQEIESHRARQDELRSDIEQKKEQIDQAKEFMDVERESLDELRQKQSEFNENNADYNRKVAQMSETLAERSEAKQTLALAHDKAKDRYERLLERQDVLADQLWQDYEMTRADAIKAGYEPATDEDHAELEKVQKECQNKLRNIGNVDLGAVEKYNEKRERYDNMKAQIDDLEKATEELQAVIKDLSTGMEGNFVESFNQINDYFGQVFAELFGGGTAELSLSDPDNVLESGIEIKAAPPGKIISSLAQLSGGEQAFIGIALFFAILKVNPTPFCFLDEIDSALDEVNVERLADYVKRYTDGTQFIMITHRRGTMAAADRLYGVTMPTRGISKVFTLNINDVQKNTKGDWNGLFG